MKRSGLTRIVLAAALAFGLAAAEPSWARAPHVGPSLAAASNFGQGFRRDILNAARALPVRDFRDAVYWRAIEGPGGQFRLKTFETTFPDLLQSSGQVMSLTVNNGHPSYDAGETPTSPAGVAAFARFAAEMVRKYPAIRAVEVGNEINSENFVSGPMRRASLPERARLYAALLKAVRDAVKAVRPDVRILGGGVHSLPVAYLEELQAAGADRDMDALAFHPYDTPPEQLVRQVAVMRALAGFADMPLEATEFGTTDESAAPGLLLRYHCQMGLAGVVRAVWYPLHPRGDGLVPLLDNRGQETAVGAAFGFVEAELAGRPVANASPDPFTYACLYEGRKLVIWGAERKLRLNRPDLRIFSATGQPIAPAEARISLDPVVIIGEATIDPGRDIGLGPQTVLADSFDQFPLNGPAPDGFTILSQRGDKVVPLVRRPGQERNGVPWFPYLADPSDPMVRVTDQVLLPGGSADSPVEILFRYRVAAAERAVLEGQLAVPDRSEDGVAVQITVNGEQVDGFVATGGSQFESPVMDLSPGDLLEVAVGPNGTARGDVTRYRLRLVKRP